MSPELETLDQLQGSEMPVAAIRSLYSTVETFLAASTAMLLQEEITLESNGAAVPSHRWEALLKDPQSGAVMRITPKGLRRIQ